MTTHTESGADLSARLADLQRAVEVGSEYARGQFELLQERLSQVRQGQAELRAWSEREFERVEDDLATERAVRQEADSTLLGQLQALRTRAAAWGGGATVLGVLAGALLGHIWR